MYQDPEKKSDTMFVDKLVKVYQKDGSEEWVLCHVEVQGTNDKEFAKRMFKYYARIFDRFDRPMTAIAIFTGRDGKKLPGMYVRKYAGAELTYKYNTLCILDYEDQAKAVGRKEALTEKETAVVKNLLAETSFSDRKIADIAGVSEAFVKEIRRATK